MTAQTSQAMSAPPAAASQQSGQGDAPRTAAVLAAGGALSDVLGLGPSDLEAIYGLAFNFYEQGKYEEAERAFEVLCFSDHRQPRHWMGLGAARQLRKDYQGAVLAYSMVAESGGTDPMAPLHAAECYLALGMPEEAISGLEAALAWAENAKDPAMVIARVEVMIEALDKLLGGGAAAASPEMETKQP